MVNAWISVLHSINNQLPLFISVAVPFSEPLLKQKREDHLKQVVAAHLTSSIFLAFVHVQHSFDQVLWKVYAEKAIFWVASTCTLWFFCDMFCFEARDAVLSVNQSLFSHRCLAKCCQFGVTCVKGARCISRICFLIQSTPWFGLHRTAPDHTVSCILNKHLLSNSNGTHTQK